MSKDIEIIKFAFELNDNMVLTVHYSFEANYSEIQPKIFMRKIMDF